MSFNCTTLDEFLVEYGDLLAAKARSTLSPLHVPSRDRPEIAPIYRKPYPAQAHVSTALCKALRRQKSCQLIAEQGSGKTFMSMAIVHTYLTANLSPEGRSVERFAGDENHPVAQQVVKVDPWRMAKIVEAGVHKSSTKEMRTFEYAGERWVSVSGVEFGTPGQTAYYQIERVAYRVMPESKWTKAMTVGTNPTGSQAESVRAGKTAIRGKVGGKMVALHSPVLFSSACPRAYRVCVVCPGQLLKKWAREIVETVPGAIVYMIESYTQLLEISRRWDDYKRNGTPFRAMGPEYYIIGRDCLKLSCGWRPAFRTRRKAGGPHCPKCGERIVKKDGKEPAPPDWLTSRTARRECYLCGERLWQEVDKPKKYSPARIVQKRLKGFFDVGVVDEAHEYKSGDSLQGDAIAGIASACKKMIPLTGTLVGGYAWHVRTMLYRMGIARTMIEDGLGWENETAFNRKYGRIETKITSSANADAAEVVKGHQQGRGGKKKGGKATSYVRPGIMPTLFRHLLWNSVFLSLDEVSEDLPPYVETLIPVAMDPELRGAYDEVDRALTDAIKEMVKKGNKKALGTLLNCLLCYPDYAYDWCEIGYYEEDEDYTDGRRRWVGIITPPSLDPEPIRQKEREIVDYCVDQKSKGRQTWVYVCYTDKRDCIARLERHLADAGLRVAVMRSSLEPKRREEWIEANGPHYDVILSHPQLVQTGLDFFNKNGRHNFCSIAFYQTGYNLFTVMQAARRAWRIGQLKACEVAFFYYENSMQSRAISLMGKKMVAAKAINGSFSAEGLAAMAGEDAGMEMELAKSLADNMDDGDGIRSWARVGKARAREYVPIEDVSQMDFGDFDDSVFDSFLGTGAASA